jgi:hypothetical protein
MGAPYRCALTVRFSSSPFRWPSSLAAIARGSSSLPTPGLDASFEDVAEDALPPIDVTIPPPDAATRCADAGATLIYLMTSSSALLSYDPASGAFVTIGTVACNSPGVPNSMAVDQAGIAYVNFNSGAIFRVSTATASCDPTPHLVEPGTLPKQFGMAFVSNTPSMGDTLFIAGDTGLDAGDIVPLATVDTTSFAVSLLGDFPSFVAAPELTGTGAGDLFAFYRSATDPNGSSAIGQVDKKTGAIVAETPLPGVVQGGGWAFAFWGGDFYTFTEPVLPGGTIVQRFRPSDGSIDVVGSLGDVVVGAGVSTCAPQE